ncbi:MAG: thiamine ABC transporter substrate binding subunit [Pseudomonadota bacterium]
MSRYIFALQSFFVCASISLAGNKPHLTVYTYKSFISEWGPGATLKKSFEAECGCELAWIPVADGAAMLARLKIEGKTSKADVVVGIDNSLIAAADKTGLFSEIKIKQTNMRLPENYESSSKFLPFDMGYYGFMFNTLAKQKSGKPYPRPKSMDELLNSPELDRSIIVEDPRSSAPGLGLLLWFHARYGADAPAKLKLFRKKVLTVSRGWSEAYGLFTKGEAPIVFSYTTSEAYHRETEKTDKFKALIFDDGHYMTVETAAILNSSTQKDLANRFLEFLTRDSSQSAIASMNWMYPVTSATKGIPASYAIVKKPGKALQIPAHDIDLNKDKWTTEWSQIFSE